MTQRMDWKPRPYRCVHCGNESEIKTNHVGEVYFRCDNPSCVSRLGLFNTGFRPACHRYIGDETGWVPEPWKTASVKVQAKSS